MRCGWCPSSRHAYASGVQPQFWFDAWSAGKINFHEGKPNSYLAEHAARLTGTSVLVPLCGKTEDLAFLAAHNHTVIGIELVEDAVRAFFSEHGLSPAIERRGALTRYASGAVTILAGDLFAVTRDDIGPIDALYDRAALVALPADLRIRYIAHLRTLLPAETPGLLVTLDYPQDQMEGPPFSVPDSEVHAHFARATQLVERPATGGRVGALGTAVERCYHVAL
jgi:thiopurine S-methyltransferase